MRHGIRHRKFGRQRGHRTALLRNLSAALVKHEQITTTLPKAKDLKPIVEKLVTVAKKGDLAARRQLMASLGNDAALAEKMISVIAKRYESRHGGYIRILKAGNRYGDAAPMGVIEFVDRDVNAKGLNSGPVLGEETAVNA